MASSREGSVEKSHAETSVGESVSRVHSTRSLPESGVSDTENGEKPVREQLKKTTIAGQNNNPDEERGHATRKRTHEDDDDRHGEEPPDPDRHVRKKSKDLSGSPRATHDGGLVNEPSKEAGSTNEEAARSHIPQSKEMETVAPTTPPSETATDDPASNVTSPKNKRPHSDAFVSGHESTINKSAISPRTVTSVTSDPEGQGSGLGSESEPKAKRPKDQTATVVQPSIHGIVEANGNSTTNDTVAAGSESSQLQQTSAAAFAASGFSALAQSSSSPFAALGAKKGASSFVTQSPGVQRPSQPSVSGSGSIFGNTSASPMPATGNTTSSPANTFGGLQNKSSLFGSSFGSGFGAIGGSKLTSFAGGNGPAITGLSSKPAKPFGAAADDGDDDDADADGGDNAGNSRGQDHEVKGPKSVETGEEDETTIFSCRTKLYNYVKLDNEKREWKERGIGTVKLNVKENTAGKKQARLLMRADGSHRLMLNTPVRKELNFGDTSGNRPPGQYVFFTGFIDNKPEVEVMQFKMKQQNVGPLYEKVMELKSQM